MRLIDVDTYSFKEMMGGNRIGDISISYAEGFNSALKAIERAPTVDAKPVVHAKWIKYENHIYDEYYYSCSSCENDWVCIEGTPKDNNMNYCPYCGAKMDL